MPHGRCNRVTKPSFLELLGSLKHFGTEFVVVGGVAAIIEGAPVTTLDLDIVYRTDPANIECLQRALQALEAIYRDPAGRVIVPTVERLRENRVNLFETSAGLLDALQEIGDEWGYQQIVSRSRERSVGELKVRVLDLVAVIESKEAAARPKDKATLPVLRETLRLKQEATGE